MKKVFTPVGVTFKGGGFYKTDSRGVVAELGEPVDGVDGGLVGGGAPAAASRLDGATRRAAGSSARQRHLVGSSSTSEPAPSTSSRLDRPLAVQELIALTGR